MIPGRRHFLGDNGFAWAASSYAMNGYDPGRRRRGHPRPAGVPVDHRPHPAGDHERPVDGRREVVAPRLRRTGDFAWLPCPTVALASTNPVRLLPGRQRRHVRASRGRRSATRRRWRPTRRTRPVPVHRAVRAARSSGLPPTRPPAGRPSPPGLDQAPGRWPIPSSSSPAAAVLVASAIGLPGTVSCPPRSPRSCSCSAFAPGRTAAPGSSRTGAWPANQRTVVFMATSCCSTSGRRSPTAPCCGYRPRPLLGRRPVAGRAAR